MKVHAAPTVPRPYDNSLREAQAQRTREQILDGLVRVLARGVAELSIPAVTREAGVSVRTVYRHFPTKRELLAAMTARSQERAGWPPGGPPRNPEELIASNRQAVIVLDQDETLRAAYASGIGRAWRQSEELPEKHRVIAEALAPITASFGEEDRAHLLAIVNVLMNRHTLHTFKEDLALTAEEAADSVGWLIRTLARLAECFGDDDVQ
jgi:AcrR family transcriptional regulator